MMAVLRYTTLLVILASSDNFVLSEIFGINERRIPPGTRPPPGSPWPMPKLWHNNSSVLTFTPKNLTLNSALRNCDLIVNAFQRLQHRLNLVSGDNQHGKNGNANQVNYNSNEPQSGEHGILPLLQEIVVYVEDRGCPAHPQLGVNENYNIDITTKVYLQAPSVWGIIWGFETLGQLMYIVDCKWLINVTSIQDGPRFQHRGLHLDTARHYYPVQLLKNNLDAMSANKLNVFHWHIVDTQAFPFRSILFPELAEKGAYSSRLTYTHQDIVEVIEYARVRGIRVIPEFDTPAHTYSWGKGRPELLTSCWANGKPDQRVTILHADKENIDPSRNSTFDFLDKFFQEVVGLFVDNHLHLGMDEASHECWQSSPNITEFTRDTGIAVGDYTTLEQYYDQRLLNIIYNKDRLAIIWEDPLNKGANISKNTVIQLWKDKSLGQPGEFNPWTSYARPILEAGYRVILSSCWYLNYIHYGQDWRNLYTCDPNDLNVTEEALSHVLGGEACTWSEYIDETNVLQVVWPRAAAVAERLWSPREVKDTDDAAFRLDQHRCRLVRQGIPAAPILPGYCHDNYNTDNSGVYELQQLQNLQQVVTPSTTTISGQNSKPFSSTTTSSLTSDQYPIVG